MAKMSGITEYLSVDVIEPN